MNVIRGRNLLSRNVLTSNLLNRCHNSSNSRSTLNEQQLNQFRSIGDQWWTGSQFEALRAMNELRVPFVRDAYNVSANVDTNKPLNGIKLLDIGCGAGLVSEPLARLGASMTGIDPIQSSIDVAVNHSSLDSDLMGKINYECVTIEEFSLRPENNESFDGIIASEVIEHIDDVELFISLCLKCLKIKGQLFITTINQTPVAYLAAILIAENVLKLLPKGTHRYNMFVTPIAITSLLQKFGCNVALIHGMCYNPLSGKWFWSQNQSVNYAVRAVKQ